MKTFSVSILLCGCIFFTAQAQEQSYLPNARQAVQKPRMQQSQYFELTASTPETPLEKQKEQLAASPNARPINYQMDRLVTMDGPKRRGKKREESTFPVSSQRLNDG